MIAALSPQRVFKKAKFNRVSVELAGDVLTRPEVAAIQSAAWDRNIQSSYKSVAEIIAAGAMPQMILGQDWAHQVGMLARTAHA